MDPLEEARYDALDRMGIYSAWDIRNQTQNGNNDVSHGGRKPHAAILPGTSGRDAGRIIASGEPPVLGPEQQRDINTRGVAMAREVLRHAQKR